MPPLAKDGYLGLRLARVPVAGSWQSLWNVKDLTGWKKASEGKAEVVMEDGRPTLHLTPIQKHGVTVSRYAGDSIGE